MNTCDKSSRLFLPERQYRLIFYNIFSRQKFLFQNCPIFFLHFFLNFVPTHDGGCLDKVLRRVDLHWHHLEWQRHRRKKIPDIHNLSVACLPSKRPLLQGKGLLGQHFWAIRCFQQYFIRIAHEQVHLWLERAAGNIFWEMLHNWA